MCALGEADVEVHADRVAEADRARVRHDRDGVGGHAPRVRDAAIVDLLDRLELDDVIAAADRADLGIARVRGAGARDVVGGPQCAITDNVVILPATSGIEPAPTAPP
jgi:hypothetical protein